VTVIMLKRLDAIVMFRMLVLQLLHNLSDE
jgi:hypothetical protein